MKIIILALLLSTCTVTPAFACEPDDVQARELLCRGPVAVIADDDPGLELYADVATSESLKEAKIELAFARGETCDDSERGAILVSWAEYEAMTVRICGLNGSVSRDEYGPVCDVPDRN